MTHKAVATHGHGYLSRRAVVNLGVPEWILPEGDEIGLVCGRDAVTGERCTHLGPAHELQAFLLIGQAFGFPGRITDEGLWLGDDLPGFTLCVKGWPETWLAELTNTCS